MNHYDDVAKFNEAFGCFRNPRPMMLLPDDVLAMRRKLIAEEFAELTAAILAGDRVEIADACADLAYVCLGWLWAVRWDTKKIVRCRGLDAMTFAKMIAMGAETIQKTAEPFWVELMFDDALNLGFAYGFPMDEIWAEVQRSNMAKLQPDGTVKRRDDGKILKPDGWTPPDIRGILERADVRKNEVNQ